MPQSYTVQVSTGGGGDATFTQRLKSGMKPGIPRNATTGKIVRPWLNLVSYSKAREIPEPEVEQPEVFLAWGGPSDFGFDVRLDAPTKNTQTVMEPPSHPVHLTEMPYDSDHARTIENFEMDNYDPSGGHPSGNHLIGPYVSAIQTITFEGPDLTGELREQMEAYKYLQQKYYGTNPNAGKIFDTKSGTYRPPRVLYKFTFKSFEWKPGGGFKDAEEGA